MVDRLGMVGLLEIALPAATVRLCDGGFVDWGGDLFTSADPLFGALASVDAVEEGIAESVPDFALGFLPPGDADPADLSQPGFQRSAVRFWLGEYAPDDGLLVGEPDLQFFGQIDQTVLTAGRGEFTLEVMVVGLLERLFTRNRGNSLNPRWHKSVWAGETGHDNATGLAVPVAWGVESQGGANGSAKGSNAGGAAPGFGGGGRGFFEPGTVDLL